MICRVELARDLSALTVSSGWRGKKQHDRAHQGHAKGLAAIQFIEKPAATSAWQQLLFQNELPDKEDVSCCTTRLILGYN